MHAFVVLCLVFPYQAKRLGRKTLARSVWLQVLVHWLSRYVCRWSDEKEAGRHNHNRHRPVTWDHLVTTHTWGRGVAQLDDDKDQWTVTMTTRLQGRILADTDRLIMAANLVTSTDLTMICRLDRMHIRTISNHMNTTILEECHSQEVAIYRMMTVELAVMKRTLITAVFRSLAHEQQLSLLIQVMTSSHLQPEFSCGLCFWSFYVVRLQNQRKPTVDFMPPLVVI